MSKADRSASAKRYWGDDESQTPIMHVDMDAFFASCEVARRPELRGLPVVVGGGNRGVVLAATYEARVYGVRSAMPMGAAHRACPMAVVVAPDYELYGAVSDSVIGMLAEITPVVEQVSVDEAFLDVSGAVRRLGPPTVIGGRLRERVQQRHGVTCSVGIGRNKLVAKLASTHAKPDGMLLVPAQATEAFMRELPVGALWGVGEVTAAKLGKWGISQVRELADLEVTTLQQMVGRAAGAHLHELAHGRDPRPVVTSVGEKSISHEHTFDVDTADPVEVSQKLLELCDQLAARLRRRGLVAGTIAVKVRTSDFATFSRSKTLMSAIDTAHVMFPVARQLVESVDLHGLPVRLVGVRAERLEPSVGAPLQATLAQATARTDFRQAEVALDRIRAKFGAGAVHLGATASGRTRPGTNG